MRFFSFFAAGICFVFSLKSQETHPVLIEHLQGILLVGNQNRQLTLPLTDLPKTEGIDWVDLEIPGNAYDLCKQLEVFLNQPIAIDHLQQIKKVVIDYYTAQSHPFVLVKVPAQEVTSGVLQIVVIESKMGDLIVEGNRYVSSAKLKRYFSTKKGAPIHESSLLRNVSFINRNPFRRVNLIFAPGKEEAETDVILAVKDRRPFRMYAGTDNLGVDPIGANQWYAGFNWGNAFHQDHILSYQFTTSYYIRRFQAHTLEYTALLSWGHLLDVYGGYSQVHPPVPAPLKRNDGWSLQASLRYVMPLKIYQYLEHEITAGGDFKRSNNTFEFTETVPVFGKNVNLTQIVLGYSGNYERNQYRLDFKGTFFWSPGRWLADQTNADYASLRPGAENKWLYFRGYLYYLQRLGSSFSLSIRLTGQGATEPLLPSEQMGLGGYDTVRGYEERVYNVDNAVVLNVETRSPGLPIAKWMKRSFTVPDALQFLVFCDAAWGENLISIPGTPKFNYLIGVGPGVRYTLEPYLTARLDWGVRLHEKAFLGSNWNRFHFNITASY